MTVFDSLGVRTIINAKGPATRLSGGRMRPEVADAMADAYERGEEVPLTDVVLAMQKSSLAFEATLQVRNKVMKAYEEIMKMPI